MSFLGCFPSRKARDMTSNASKGRARPVLPQRLDGRVRTSTPTQSRRPLQCLDRVRDFLSRAFAAVLSCCRRSAPPAPGQPVSVAAALQMLRQGASLEQTVVAESVDFHEADPEEFAELQAAGVDLSRVSITGEISGAGENESGESPLQMLRSAARLAQAGASVQGLKVSGRIAFGNAFGFVHTVPHLLTLHEAGVSLSQASLEGQVWLAKVPPPALLALAQKGVGVGSLKVFGKIELASGQLPQLQALHQAGFKFGQLEVVGEMPLAEAQPQALQALHQAGVDFEELRIVGEVSQDAEETREHLRSLARLGANIAGIVFVQRSQTAPDATPP